MATDRIRNILFLCTGNSARSIIGEALINHWGAGKLRGFSAGSFPKGMVNRHTLDLLERMELPIAGLRSKSWSEFATPGAPSIDFIITVCDQAANEICPIWPGRPMTAHWPFPDPAAFEGSEAETGVVFTELFRMMEKRIKIFCALPLASLSNPEIQREIRALGTGTPQTA